MTDVDLTQGIYRRQYSGFRSGRRICSVSIGAEAWFWRLHACADDYGNFLCEPGLYESEARGRRRDVSDAQAEAWVQELKDANLIRLYHVKTDRYGSVVDWADTQKAASRNGKRVRRFPDPSGCTRLHLDAPGCAALPQMHPPDTDTDIAIGSGGKEFEGNQVRTPTGSWNLHASKLVAMFPEALKGGPTKAMKAAANALATVNVTHNGQAFAWLSERVPAYVKSPMAKSEAAVWAPTFFSDEWYNRESFPAPNKTGRKGGPTEVVEDTTAYGAH